ncbi:hypothetical protein QR680_011946 [Steinernema hermaphroditum]|uniref:Uncharacterized protein n=1 Tax=Steinernema hermaphroditum TaxID=289476 RepID=A0AA39I0B1_9BILA|nr:hypothetical protein QR680_011946 [Steinernema hermaphroditum]
MSILLLGEMLPILVVIIFLACADGCARMKPSDQDVTKGVCDQNHDSEYCQESTKTPMITIEPPTSTTTTSTMTTTTTSMTTTTTTAPLITCSPPMNTSHSTDDYKIHFNGKNFVLIRDETNRGMYWIYNTDRVTRKVEYKNHVVFDLSEKPAGDAMALYCDVGDSMCICDGNMACLEQPVISDPLTHYLIVVVDCANGPCTVNGAISKNEVKENAMKNVHYFSCNKCANKIQLDNSPPLKPCFQTAEELGKLDVDSCSLGSDVQYQMCKVENEKDVVGKVVVDHTSPQYWYHPTDYTQRCRYATGVDLIHFKKPKKAVAPTQVLTFHGEHCVKTADNEFYVTKASWSTRQFCSKTGECSLFAFLQQDLSTIVSVKDPSKTFTREKQEKANADGKTFNDPTAYLQDIIWLLELLRSTRWSAIFSIFKEIIWTAPLTAYRYVICAPCKWIEPSDLEHVDNFLTIANGSDEKAITAFMSRDLAKLMRILSNSKDEQVIRKCGKLLKQMIYLMDYHPNHLSYRKAFTEIIARNLSALLPVWEVVLKDRCIRYRFNYSAAAVVHKMLMFRETHVDFQLSKIVIRSVMNVKCCSSPKMRDFLIHSLQFLMKKIPQFLMQAKRELVAMGYLEYLFNQLPCVFGNQNVAVKAKILANLIFLVDMDEFFDHPHVGLFYQMIASEGYRHRPKSDDDATTRITSLMAVSVFIIRPDRFKEFCEVGLFPLILTGLRIKEEDAFQFVVHFLLQMLDDDYVLKYCIAFDVHGTVEAAKQTSWKPQTLHAASLLMKQLEQAEVAKKIRFEENIEKAAKCPQRRYPNLDEVSVDVHFFSHMSYMRFCW